MREHFAIEAIDDDIQIAVGELSGLVGDLGIGLFRTLLANEGHSLFHHRDGFIFGGKFSRSRREIRSRRQAQSQLQFLSLSFQSSVGRV